MLCLIVCLGAAGCGGGHSPVVRSAASSEFQAYAPQPDPVSREEPAPEPESRQTTTDEDDDEASLVRRPLTDEEKKSVVAAYKLEQTKALDDARKRRQSEDQLTRGIHKREVAKIAAQLQARTRTLQAAKKAGKMSPEQLERELEAARAAAKLAREESLRTKDDALKAAAAMEAKAVQAAAAMFEENCKALDQMTVADFEATAR
jgi:hypothetical protein